MWAINNNLGKTAKIGTVRELFMLNQLQNTGYIPTYTSKGDLFIDGYTFEVGGKNKNSKQIKNIKKLYLVPDDVIVNLKLQFA